MKLNIKMIEMDGKKVLLVAPLFFGYEQEIKNEMLSRGAIVDFLPDRPFNKPWQSALTRLFPRLMLPWIERHYNLNYQKIFQANYDLVLVINGQTLSTKLLMALKNQSPNAQFILYMWDSIKNRPRTIKALKYYNKTFTFDSEDAIKYGMQLRPLFFINKYKEYRHSTKDFDLCFIGTMHSDRFSVMQRLKCMLNGKANIFSYFYLQAKWVYWIYKLTNPAFKYAKITDFAFKPIDKTLLHDAFANSIAIADIEHPQQNGLTMRTFETIGAHKKLITTNEKIKLYDFYQPENILVIDRLNPVVTDSFFKSEYKTLADSIYLKYSITGWLNELLS
jgi:hypothetical protein